MRFIKATAVIIAIITLIACKQNSNNSKYVVTSSVGNIIFSDFQDQMLKKEFEGDKLKAANSKMEQRERFLNSMIMDNIVKDMAAKNDLDTVKTVKDKFHNILFYDAIVNHMVVDSVESKIFSQKDVLDTYEKKKTDYFPKHILIAVDKSLNDTQAKMKIDSIYNELVSGKDFSELAKKYSSDKKTGVNGGELGWLHSYDLLEEFENVLIKLKKGEISKPFKTKYGYHIALLSDIKNNEDLKPFEEEKGVIEKELTAKYGKEYSNESRKFLDNIMVRLNVRIDTLGIKTLVKQYRKNELEFKDTDKDPISRFSNEDRKKILASFNDVKIDIDTLLTMMGTIQINKRPPLKNLNNVIDILKNILKIKMLENYAENLGYTKRPELIEKAKDAMLPTYKDVLINKLVKSKIEISEKEIEEFYKENMDKYKTPEGYDPIDKVKAGIKNSIKGKKFKKELNKWEDDLFKNYDVKVNKVLLEETFYYVSDDKQ